MKIRRMVKEYRGKYRDRDKDSAWNGNEQMERRGRDLFNSCSLVLRRSDRIIKRPDSFFFHPDSNRKIRRRPVEYYIINS